GRHFPFDDAAIRRIHLRSGGIPRLVNVIAERALLAGYARDRSGIDAALVEEAAREALPPGARPDGPDGRGGRGRRGLLLAAGGAAAAAALVAAAALWPGGGTPGRGEPPRARPTGAGVPAPAV